MRIEEDERYMRMALELAVKGEGYASPNPMVGAVLVKDGKVVGRGYHRAPGLPHAEVEAIADAGENAAGATLYVSLEPCNHTGRTPPCTGKVIAAGISRVVAAMKDPNRGVRGGGAEYLSQHGIRVDVGVCEAEAVRLNEAFVKHVRTGLPFVIVKCAATLDGRIATRTGDSRWVTGPESREYAHRIRHAVDAILVGIETVRRDDPSLTAQPASMKGKDPIRLILDTRLTIPESARVLSLPSDSDTILVIGEGPDDPRVLEKRARIEKGRVKILETRVKDGRIDLPHLLQLLGKMGITSLLIEGGGRVIGSALSAGIVDKVLFFFAPKILGGDDGAPVCRGEGAERMDECLRVRDMSVRRFGEDVLIEGYIG